MELSVGLPRMHKEAGERRDLLPGLVSFLSRAGFGDIVVEEGYGTGIGFGTASCLEGSGRARAGTYEESLDQTSWW